jgi:1,4-alpha-glucan branching enzyme
MKSKRKSQNGHVNSSELVPVRFEFAHPTAATVCVAGSFNQWKPARTLHPKGRGRWSTETELPPGTYEYCLIVDGQWMPDPQAPATVPNPFGGRNSILEVAAGPQANPPGQPERRPTTNGK